MIIDAEYPAPGRRRYLGCPGQLQGCRRGGDSAASGGICLSPGPPSRLSHYRSKSESDRRAAAET